MPAASAAPRSPAAGPRPLPPSLAAALAEHAAAHPERPFLFWPEGLDWRWLPFAAAAADVARLRGGSAARLEEASAAPAAAIALLREIAAGGPEADRRRIALASALAVDLETAPGAARRRRRREIVVLAPPPPDEAGESRLFAWAVLAGAAVVVEPAPAGLVATAAWARPTVFGGTAAEIAALRREAEAAEDAGPAGWWRRLRRRLGAPAPPPPPFHRLHTLLVAGPPPGEGELDFWRRRGTRVLVEPPAAPAPPATPSGRAAPSG